MSAPRSQHLGYLEYEVKNAEENPIYYLQQGITSFGNSPISTIRLKLDCPPEYCVFALDVKNDGLASVVKTSKLCRVLINDAPITTIPLFFRDGDKIRIGGNIFYYRQKLLSHRRHSMLNNSNLENIPNTSNDVEITGVKKRTRRRASSTVLQNTDRYVRCTTLWKDSPISAFFTNRQKRRKSTRKDILLPELCEVDSDNECSDSDKVEANKKVDEDTNDVNELSNHERDDKVDSDNLSKVDGLEPNQNAEEFTKESSNEERSDYLIDAIIDESLEIITDKTLDLDTEHEECTNSIIDLSDSIQSTVDESHTIETTSEQAESCLYGVSADQSNLMGYTADNLDSFDFAEDNTTDLIQIKDINDKQEIQCTDNNTEVDYNQDLTAGSICKKISTPQPVSNSVKENNSPVNDLTDVRGVKRMFRTPKPQKSPNNDLTNIHGVKTIFATLKRTKSPINDLTDVKGVKRMLQTPKLAKSPNNDLTNVAGVKKLFETPKERKSPVNDLTNVRGLKKCLQTPKSLKSPLNDLREVHGVKNMFTTPKTLKSPNNDLSKISGVKALFSRVSNSGSPNFEGLTDSLKSPKTIDDQQSPKEQTPDPAILTEALVNVEIASLKSPVMEIVLREKTKEPEESSNTISETLDKSKLSIRLSISFERNTMGNDSVIPKIGAADESSISPTRDGVNDIEVPALENRLPISPSKDHTTLTPLQNNLLIEELPNTSRLDAVQMNERQSEEKSRSIVRKSVPEKVHTKLNNSKRTAFDKLHISSTPNSNVELAPIQDTSPMLETISIESSVIQNNLRAKELLDTSSDVEQNNEATVDSTCIQVSLLQNNSLTEEIFNTSTDAVATNGMQHDDNDKQTVLFTDGSNVVSDFVNVRHVLRSSTSKSVLEPINNRLVTPKNTVAKKSISSSTPNRSIIKKATIQDASQNSPNVDTTCTESYSQQNNSLTKEVLNTSTDAVSSNEMKDDEKHKALITVDSNVVSEIVNVTRVSRSSTRKSATEKTPKKANIKKCNITFTPNKSIIKTATIQDASQNSPNVDTTCTESYSQQNNSLTKEVLNTSTDAVSSNEMKDDEKHKALITIDSNVVSEIVNVTRVSRSSTRKSATEKTPKKANIKKCNITFTPNKSIIKIATIQNASQISSSLDTSSTQGSSQQIYLQDEELLNTTSDSKTVAIKKSKNTSTPDSEKQNIDSDVIDGINSSDVGIKSLNVAHLDNPPIKRGQKRANIRSTRGQTKKQIIEVAPIQSETLRRTRAQIKQNVEVIPQKKAHQLKNKLPQSPSVDLSPKVTNAKIRQLSNVLDDGAIPTSSPIQTKQRKNTRSRKIQQEVSEITTETSKVSPKTTTRTLRRGKKVTFRESDDASVSKNTIESKSPKELPTKRRKRTAINDAENEPVVRMTRARAKLMKE